MKEKIVILTGGSRGIGHATSKTFWENGWRVITCSRSEVAPQCPWEKNKTDHFQIDLENLDILLVPMTDFPISRSLPSTNLIHSSMPWVLKTLAASNWIPLSSTANQ